MKFVEEARICQPFQNDKAHLLADLTLGYWLKKDRKLLFAMPQGALEDRAQSVEASMDPLFIRIVEAYESYVAAQPKSMSEIYPIIEPSLEVATPFQRKVLEAVLQVPFGALASYKDLACAIGQPLSARAVGGALGQNRLLVLIPCHRVVQSNGGLGGFAGHVPLKKALIEFESSKA